MTAIYELQQILNVNTEFGQAQVLFIFDYGIQSNSIWVCASYSDGKIRHFDTSEITIYPNHTINFNINEN
jgi:hypothetical protein